MDGICFQVVNPAAVVECVTINEALYVGAGAVIHFCFDQFC